MKWQHIGFFVFFALCSCDGSPSRPAGASDRVILLGTEAGEILVMDPQASNARPSDRIPIPRHVEGFAVSPDRSTLYFSAFNQLPDRTVHALDLRTLDIVRTRSIADLLATDVTQDIVDTGESIAVSPDGSTLFIAGWRSGNAELGLGMVDAETMRATGFTGPLRVKRHGLATLPPTPDQPSGAVLALGRQLPSSESVLSLFMIDAGTGEIVDSFPGVTADTSVYQLVPAADGRSVYLSGARTLARYDLEERMLRETVELPTLGWLTLSTDGQELYRTDQKMDLTSAGTGKVFIFGPALDLREPIDLANYSQDGYAPVTLSAATSHDGQHLYVVTGTGSFGRAPPYQQGRLFVVRRADHHVVRIIELNAWNVGPPILTR